VTAALETTRLGKRYKRSWALRDCSLRLPAGRVAGLVGPNGAGKTTLLHLAVGLLRPSEGSVRVLGESPSENPGLLARVGFVAQDTPLYPGFTADGLIAMGCHLNPRWDASLARDRLRKLGIPLGRRVRKLSGGQRAQVALSLALAKGPELLLLDEPVASLDPLARREFLQGLMGAVADEGTTVLLSSHVVADLERVCDYLVILSAGRVQVLGAVDDLLAEHRVLVGPRRDPVQESGVGPVVSATHTERQSTLLVRVNGRVPDGWVVHEASLEEIVLAYLADESARALSGPAPMEPAEGRE
jgi:ABC-2 type transport system ATP-binding protein